VHLKHRIVCPLLLRFFPVLLAFFPTVTLQTASNATCPALTQARDTDIDDVVLTRGAVVIQNVQAPGPLGD